MLDFGFTLPDCVWALPPDERSPRNSKDFAELGKRRFVRGLLPIQIVGGEEFRFGVWLEVEPDVFDVIVASWNDEVAYPQLTFVATIANAVPPWRGKTVGAEVHVGVRDQKSRPFVVSSHVEWLQDVLERGWTEAQYDAAVESFG